MALSIGTYITKTSNQLNKLVKRAGGLRSLETRFKERLDPDLRDHIHITAISRDSITLLTDSTARCTQLRFMVPEFLHLFHEILGNEDLNQIKIQTGHPNDFNRVLPQAAAPHGRRAKPRQLCELKKLLEEKKPRK